MSAQRFGQVTVELPAALYEELRAEAARQCKPISAVMRVAWNLARRQMQETRHPRAGNYFDELYEKGRR